MTDDQLHRILTGQDKRCSDKVCRKICRAEDTKLGLCMSCWNAYSDLVRTEKDKLQDKVTRIASKLVSNLAETCSVRRCAQKLLEGPRVFEKGVRAREINPRAVKRVLAFGYQFGLSTGDCEMAGPFQSQRKGRGCWDGGGLWNTYQLCRKNSAFSEDTW